MDPLRVLNSPLLRTSSLSLSSSGSPHSDPRRMHRPIPSHSFRQSFEAKSAHAQQAFFQEFEVRPAAPCSEQVGPRAPGLGLPRRPGEPSPLGEAGAASTSRPAPSHRS